MKSGYESPYPKMVDTWLSVHPQRSEVSTRKNFGGLFSGDKINHISISENSIVLDVMIDTRKVNGRHPSDHFPVIAKIIALSYPAVSKANYKKNTVQLK